METKKNTCTGMDEKLADLLLDPAAAPENVTTHVAECEDCQRQLEELRATMALLDTWEAPEPNPYFMTRFEARLREERKAAPAGWLRTHECAHGFCTVRRPMRAHWRPWR